MRGEWDVEVGPKLLQREKELGFDDYELAERAGTDLVATMEIVNAENVHVEIIYPMSVQKKIYDALGLNLLDLFEVQCAYCRGDEGVWHELAALPRDEMIRSRREQLGLSLGDISGRWLVYAGVPLSRAFFDLIESIEDGPNSVDDLAFIDVINLAEILQVPPQLLLGVTCSQCEK